MPGQHVGELCYGRAQQAAHVSTLLDDMASKVQVSSWCWLELGKLMALLTKSPKHYNPCLLCDAAL
jgi:hypothetical protein